MSKEMDFFIYLIENYAYYKGTTGDKVMKELIDLNILKEIFENYEFYHIDKLENAYEDIDKLISEANGKN